jgi:hypothetical protein
LVLIFSKSLFLLLPVNLICSQDRINSNAAAWNRQAQCPGPKIQKVGGAFAPKYKNVARNPKKLPLKLKQNKGI